MTIINKQATGFLKGFFLVLLLALTFTGQYALAMSSEECLECHSDEDMTAEKDGKEYSIFVDGDVFSKSVHGGEGCVHCHPEADANGDEHPFPLPRVNCGECHEEVGDMYDNSLHGKARSRGDELAPYCHACHGKHDILPSRDHRSKVHVLNIPATCGVCHKEGTAITETHDIAQHNILDNYSMSIHGEGLLKKGLTVTAVCTSCHTSHNLLSHTDPNSTIHRDNVAKTCMQCHGLIEETHTRFIRGELWEKEPHKIPTCVECHGPHKARRVLYEDSLNDEFCLGCHGDPELTRILKNGVEISLYVDVDEFDEFKGTKHKKERLACVKCHTNMDNSKKIVCKDSGPVDCAICHAAQVKEHNESTHGKLAAANNPNAPGCKDCHGRHDAMPHENPDSPIFSRNVPMLCAKCHREGEKAAVKYTGTQHNIVKTYTMSTHGKGLIESGLMVSASCTNCHTAHSVLPSSDPRSRINRAQITDTCGVCHLGIAEQFKSSIHSTAFNKTDKKLPECVDCHSSHSIARHDTPTFRTLILDQCGTCHKHESESYFETYHGKASLLSGGEKTAKCSDCHGSHNILPAFYPDSMLHRQNVVETCKSCHPGSNRKFTGYLTHATHHDRDKYPYLFYTFWGMSGLLISTFLFFGLHTLFWIPRSFRERFKKRRAHMHGKK